MLSVLLIGCNNELQNNNEQDTIIGYVALGDEIDGEIEEIIDEDEIMVKINKIKGKKFSVGEKVHLKYSSVEITYNVTDKNDFYVLDNEELYEEKEYEKHYVMNVGDVVSFWVADEDIKKNRNDIYVEIDNITKIVYDPHLQNVQE